jgi:hypothetical protein
LAGVIVQNRSAHFTSDLENDIILTFDTFDNAGGTITLDNVRIDISHAGGAILRADNDDDFKEADVNGRIVRTWSLSAPDAFAIGNETVTTPVVHLGLNDGDGGDTNNFDATGPDGTDFGNVTYGPLALAPIFPNEAFYETNGPGSLDMTADVLFMINDLQFVVPPDVWQLEVQDPFLDIDVTLTYFFSVIPVPPALWLGAVGLGVAGWIRRRVR